MYKIFANNTCIYDDQTPLEEYKLNSPKLSLSDNSAGSLTLSIPPTNVGYDLVNRLVTELMVTENGDEIWRGRVMSEKTNFWNCRDLTCEGELAYLNDTIQPPADYYPEEGYKWNMVLVKEMLEAIIENHNSNLNPNDPIDKHFTVGTVDVEDLTAGDDVHRYTNYETTLECLSTINDAFNGHLIVRHEIENGVNVRYLDYKKNYNHDTTAQIIEFGKNLMDFSKNYSIENFATVVIPKGKQLDDETIQGLYSYQTVASGVSPEIQQQWSTYHDEGSIYVYNHDESADSPLNMYGRIEVVHDLSDVASADELLLKSVLYLQNTQFEDLTLEVKAYDFSLVDVDAGRLKLLDDIRVISPPHGMDKYFPLTKIEIDLANPANTTFTLGKEVVEKLTVQTRKLNESIIEQINKTVVMKETVLSKAKDYASTLVRESTGGYVTMIQNGDHTEAIAISSGPDYLTSDSLWLWNRSGLAFFPNGYSNPAIGTALTSDGAIVADMITAGKLNADMIQTGKLQFFDTETGEVAFSFDTSNGEIILKGYQTSSQTADAIQQGVNDAVSLANENTRKMISFDPATGLKIFGDGSGGTGNNYVLISNTRQSFVVSGVEAMSLDSFEGIATKGLNAVGNISGKSVGISHWRWIEDTNGSLKLIREE